MFSVFIWLYFSKNNNPEDECKLLRSQIEYYEMFNNIENTNLKGKDEIFAMIEAGNQRLRAIKASESFEIDYYLLFIIFVLLSNVGLGFLENKINFYKSKEHTADAQKFL
jgi:hypothetical protein